eukprot:scaffold225243_cov32-Tisochrysis_lutea.AAC.5
MEGGLAPPHSLDSPHSWGARTIHPPAPPLGMQRGLTQTAQTILESRAQIARPAPRCPAPSPSFIALTNPSSPGPPDQEPPASSSQPSGAR